jgi:hypothetical protein
MKDIIHQKKSSSAFLFSDEFRAFRLKAAQLIRDLD